MTFSSLLQRRPASHTHADVAALLEREPSADFALFADMLDVVTLAETLVALANSHGGTVVLASQDASADALRELAQAACLRAQPPLILPLPEIFNLSGKVVCLQVVPPGLPHVYNVSGAFFMRGADRNRTLSTEELRRLLIQRDPGTAGFEAQVVPGARIDDLDSQRVNKYLQALHGLTEESAEEVLLSRGCLVEVGDVRLPTYAGILLFGRDPQRFLRSAEIIAVRYRGNDMGDEFVRQDLRGTLGQQIRLAEAFVSDNMRRVNRIHGLERNDAPEYPISVVREVIVNAVAHRDYAARGEGIRLLMFGDRLQIYSPGRLPGHVTLDNLLNERYSRNEAIVQILSDMGYIERLGYGIDRILRAMSDNNLPPPRFEETAAGFQVTLVNGLQDDAPPAEIVAPRVVPPAPETLTGRWRSHFVNPRQERALHFVEQRGRITNSDFQALELEVSAETLRRDLADLVEQGILIKVGEKRATYYILK